MVLDWNISLKSSGTLRNKLISKNNSFPMDFYHNLVGFLLKYKTIELDCGNCKIEVSTWK